MEEKYVSFETAKLLKKYGFNWDCSSYWAFLVSSEHPDGEYVLCTNATKFKYDDKTNKYSIVLDFKNHNDGPEGEYQRYSAPTLSLAQKWLREVKEIEVQVTWCVTRNNETENWTSWSDRKYKVEVQKDKQEIDVDDNQFNTYEDALEYGINQTLKAEEKII